MTYDLQPKRLTPVRVVMLMCAWSLLTPSLVLANSDFEAARARFTESSPFDAAVTAYKACQAGKVDSCMQSALWFIIDGHLPTADDLLAKTKGHNLTQDFAFELNVLMQRAKEGRLAYGPALKTIQNQFPQPGLNLAVTSARLDSGVEFDTKSMTQIDKLCSSTQTAQSGQQLLSKIPKAAANVIDCNSLRDTSSVYAVYGRCRISPRAGKLFLPIKGWPTDKVNIYRTRGGHEEKDELLKEWTLVAQATEAILDLSHRQDLAPYVTISKVAADVGALIDDTPIQTQREGHKIKIFVPLGGKILRLQKDARQPWERAYDLRYGEQLELEARMDLAPPLWRMALGIAGGALLAGGGSLVALSAATASNAQTTLTDSIGDDGFYSIGAYQSAKDGEATANALAIGGLSGIGLGLTATASALIHWLLADTTAPEWK
jgi:hypothetical protein